MIIPTLHTFNPNKANIKTPQARFSAHMANSPSERLQVSFEEFFKEYKGPFAIHRNGTCIPVTNPSSANADCIVSRDEAGKFYIQRICPEGRIRVGKVDLERCQTEELKTGDRIWLGNVRVIVPKLPQLVGNS